MSKNLELLVEGSNIAFSFSDSGPFPHSGTDFMATALPDYTIFIIPRYITCLDCLGSSDTVLFTVTFIDL